MRREYASLRRRPFLTPVWILTIWAAVALALAAWAVHAATTTIVVVVRHADKSVDGSDDPPLSPAGVERAARLAALLGARGTGTGIDAIIVSRFRRSGATAQPLAAAASIPVVTLPSDDLAAIERRVNHDYRGKRVLIVAHADTLPALVRRLGETAEIAPVDANDYGTAYVIAMPRFGRPTVLRLALP